MRSKGVVDGVIVADARESPARGIVEGLSDFGVEVYGWDPLLGKDEIGGFDVRALDDMLQITDYCPKGVDGAIVAVAHDEFRGMGLSGVRGLLGAEAVGVDVCSMQGVEGTNIAKVAVERWVPSIRVVNASEQYLKHDDELLIGE